MTTDPKVFLGKHLYNERAHSLGWDWSWADPEFSPAFLTRGRLRKCKAAEVLYDGCGLSEGHCSHECRPQIVASLQQVFSMVLCPCWALGALCRSRPGPTKHVDPRRDPAGGKPWRRAPWLLAFRLKLGVPTWGLYLTDPSALCESMARVFVAGWGPFCFLPQALCRPSWCLPSPSAALRELGAVNSNKHAPT